MRFDIQIDDRQAAREFPAHAGMNRRKARWRTASSRVPRTRGDERVATAAGGDVVWSSPHTRG